MDTRSCEMPNAAYPTIAEHFGYPHSKTFSKILANIFDPQEALIVAELPSPPEGIAAKLSMDRGVVEECLQGLARKGALVRGSKGYRLSRMVVEFRDLVIQHPELQPPLLDELSDLWAQFAQEVWYRDMAAWYASATEPPMRVVPAIKAIKDDPDLTPDEDLREILKTKESIAIGLCPCRRQSSAYRANRDLEVCFLFDHWAAAGIERGALRKVTYDEALEAASLAEENGLVHTLGPTAMCSCNTDYCVMAVPLTQHDIPVSKAWARGAYWSVTDQEACSGCQDCMEWCAAGAIEMVKVQGSKKLKATVDKEKCIGCGVCVIKCDVNAITLTRGLAQAQ